MKVLFLDIDGVLNSQTWWENMPKEEKDLRWETNDHFDLKAVRLLNEILEKTGAKVVISSSWRNLFDWDELMDILKRNGVKAEILGKTPAKFSYRPRGYDIQEWLGDNEDLDIDTIAIVDDDADMASMEPWLVRTLWITGLRKKDAEKLETKLSEPNWPPESWD